MAQPSPGPQEPRPAFRIVRSDDEASTPAGGSSKLSGHSTLTQLYHQGFVPLWLEPQQADRKTRDLYEQMLEHWRELTPLDGQEPRLWQIETDPYIAARFVKGLASLPGNKPGTTMAIGTIRKHVTMANTLLGFAGPRERTRHGHRNLALIAEPPLVDKPPADVQAPEGDWSIEEVRAMWLAAARMISPARLPGVRPAAFWRSLLTVAAYTALRRGQLLGLAYADLTAPFILVRSSRSKGRRGKKQYLPQGAIEAIEAIRTPREKIFAWPHVVRHIDAQLRRLAQLANLPRERWFGWNGFRKCAGTLAYEIGGAAGSQAVLGHSREGTGLAHYVNGNAQARRAAAVIDQMPSPQPLPTSGEKQHRLFD